MHSYGPAMVHAEGTMSCCRTTYMAVLQNDFVTEEQAREMGLLEGPSIEDRVKGWMTLNTRHSMREARMLRKFWVRTVNSSTGFFYCSVLSGWMEVR